MLINLINEKIIHKIFGVGNIVEQEEAVITVKFDNEKKRFVYPDAIGKFIELKDEETAKSMEKVFAKLDEKKKVKRKEAKKQQLRARYSSSNIHESSQIVFWLDDEEKENIFTEWEAFAGTIQSGESKGEPNRPARLRPNSAVLLTMRDEEEQETERKIIGFFMVHETLSGDSIDDGIVFSHEKYRVQLTDEQADQLLFWDYYINKNFPHRMTWNSGKYRYFDNIWMAQIIKDVINLSNDDKQIELLNEFLNHFCMMNAIDKDDIPEADGALKQ